MTAQTSKKISVNPGALCFHKPPLTKSILCLIFSIGFFLSFYNEGNAQNYGELWTVELSSTVQTLPFEITLNWADNESPGDSYLIWRKVKGDISWGGTLITLPSSSLSYTDNSVIEGVSYEYRVQKQQGGTLNAWGYINSGINTEINPDKGDLLLLIDSTFISTLNSEIILLAEDLSCDGWHVNTEYINRTSTVLSVKSKVIAAYNSLPNLTTLYILGHVPVPYSGNLNPDGHPDHQGAWPADVYYADIDGVWTDVSINNSVASDIRNQNVIGDGKFDQSQVPSEVELQTGRVDFANMGSFSTSEEELLRNYLNKAHDFKIAGYVPIEKGIIDQGNFETFQEGFTQNGYRNFTPFFGSSNVDSADYFSSLTTSDYLWSYGCGAGSYTSAASLDGGSTLTTSELSNNDLLTTFTMLFGSYFGDWDRSNNLLRAALASGKTLGAVWAGRPNWHFHTMASGDHIGVSAQMSQQWNTKYLSLNLAGGFVTGEGVHVALMGDPSVRMYYESPASNLLVVNNANTAELNWTASTDLSIDGYNVYRRETGNWIKVNPTLITATSYADLPPSAGTWNYMVKSIKLKTNSSGSFYNESLGVKATEFFNVDLMEAESFESKVFPNPATDFINISMRHASIYRIDILDALGKNVFTKTNLYGTNQLNLSELPAAVYFVKSTTEDGRSHVTKLFLK
ncbi:MAG: hypothetical protein ACI9J3_002571 [Parvicellaceae bacterium]|jgi:hypothetical protein